MNSSEIQDDLQALNDLEKRQENILNQLENLKLEVEKLKIPPGKSSANLQKKPVRMKYFFKNIYFILKLHKKNCVNP